MKKITLLLALLIAYFGYSQPTTDPTAPPSRDAGDVISIFSGAYTNVNVTNFDPNWGQSGHMQINSAFDTGSGNLVLAYPNFNYQGTELEAQNASSMEFLHVDIWTDADPSGSIIQVSPINGGGVGEVLVTINHAMGGWTSVDIPKASFTGMTWDNVIQMKFAANGPGSAVPIDIYVDNIYFWKTAADPLKDATLSDLKVDGETINAFGAGTIDYVYEVPIGTTVVPQITSVTTTNGSAINLITQAVGIPGDATVLVTSADASTTETYTVSFTATLPNTPPIPSTPNAEVLSIYGDTGGFTNVWTSDYQFGSFAGKPDLDQSGAVNEVIKMDFSVAGYGEGTNAKTDVSSYNWLHFDYFADSDATEIRMILIGEGIGEFFYELTPGGSDGTLVTGAWTSVDIPLSVFVGKGWDKTNYLQFKLGTTSDLVSKVVYFDNIYFSANQGTTLGTNSFEQIAFEAYPNPTQNKWTIRTKNQNIESVNVYDVLGKNVLSLKYNDSEAEIDASSLKAGLYFAQVKTEQGITSLKLIKN
ncbi:hypothetical protein A8C32_13760 [Flavivirga aquatica]|uniref:Secretion system C-terminal sorting domain-containing protein n=1 Tax=Flavivirga aquatica TaxID=1849968 RepID=A0A1E5TCM6_9FLAO|nr:T9SS type A sorting domain-containing protein [Flavivirga aquatica]OEK09108.1 hypothetical protein A8C32_13760 [Flavivirga aquatica]